jgi:hypothetical protein
MSFPLLLGTAAPEQGRLPPSWGAGSTGGGSGTIPEVRLPLSVTGHPTKGADATNEFKITVAQK